MTGNIPGNGAGKPAINTTNLTGAKKANDAKPAGDIDLGKLAAIGNQVAERYAHAPASHQLTNAAKQFVG